MKPKKAVAGLPSGVAVYRITTSNSPLSNALWRVRLGRRFTGGKVQLKHFGTLAEARRFVFGDEATGQAGDAAKLRATPGGATELKAAAGAAAFTLTPRQLATASDAFKRLEPYGLDLAEAVTIALRHSRPKAGALAFAEALPLFLKAPRKRPLGPDTAKAYGYSLLLLAGDVPKKKVHEVGKADVEDFLQDDEWEPATQAHHLRNISVFYNWAVKTGHAGFNPCADIPEPADDKEPVALTAAQAARLLAAAETVPGMLVPVALGLLGGLRTSEIRRLTWEEVGDKEVEIKPAKTKTRRRRMVSINDALGAWLATCRQPSGRVAPDDWRAGFENVLEAAGYRVGEPKEGEEERPAWPRNAMRHSFGSFHYAKHKNETLTAAEMGNSPAMVFQHYRRVFKAAEVERFWSLRPATDEKIVRLTAAA